MKNFLYYMTSDDPAPVGDGDTRSWFMFYKWNVDDLTFVPRTFPFWDAEVGDFVWFSLDGFVFGGAEITQVETPTLRVQTQEIWYDPREGLELDQAFLATDASEANVELFKKYAKKRK